MSIHKEPNFSEFMEQVLELQEDTETQEDLDSLVEEYGNRPLTYKDALYVIETLSESHMHNMDVLVGLFNQQTESLKKALIRTNMLSDDDLRTLLDEMNIITDITKEIESIDEEK